MDLIAASTRTDRSPSWRTPPAASSLYLDRRRSAGRLAPIAGLVLNSPWFDLQGKPVMRGPVTWAMRGWPGYGRSVPWTCPGPSTPPPCTPAAPASGTSTSISSPSTGSRSPSAGSTRSAAARPTPRPRRRRPVAGAALGQDELLPDLLGRQPRQDTVLDVQQIARWAGCLGREDRRRSRAGRPPRRLPLPRRAAPVRLRQPRPLAAATPAGHAGLGAGSGRPGLRTTTSQRAPSGPVRARVAGSPEYTRSVKAGPSRRSLDDRSVDDDPGTPARSSGREPASGLPAVAPRLVDGTTDLGGAVGEIEMELEVPSYVQSQAVTLPGWA